MATKRFNNDVQSARNRIEDSGVDGVITLEQSNDPGEVVFTFINETLDIPIPIHLVSANLAGYPEDNNFLLHTTARTSPPVAAALENLQNYTFGQTVFESLRDVATGLTRILRDAKTTKTKTKTKTTDSDGDAVMAGTAIDDADMDSDFGSDGSDCIPDDFGADSDEELSNFSERQGGRITKTLSKMAPGVLRIIKRDLRKARESDAKIGILSGVAAKACTHLISVSIRARKLGISDEALEAWDVDPLDYVVLLLRLDEPYPSAEKLLNTPSTLFSAAFRLGQCKRSKPSHESARKAFVDAPGARSTASDTAAKDDRNFRKLFLSNSLDQYMDDYFLAMFKLRLHGVSDTWDAANSHIQDVHVGHIDDEPTLVKGKGKGKDKGKGKAQASPFLPDAFEQQTLPTILTWDPFAQDPADISMPLVAFQFALHYFIRCTEYCLRCHRKVDKEFEALKPYVCQNPLCLFQYITMGLGPSIEHEVMTQPYVVDLLVTLCYASIFRARPNYAHPPLRGVEREFAIRDFPTGLRLKGPMLPTPLKPPEQLSESKDPPPASTLFVKVSVNQANNSFRVEEDTYSTYSPPVREKTWVVLRRISDVADEVGKTYHAYIHKFDGMANLGQLELKCGDNFEATTGKVMMELYNYNTDCDDLDNEGKARLMRLILETLPPIAHIREWLFHRPHSRIRNNPEISPSAAILLDWIIASNRSLILQVSKVIDHHDDQKCVKTIKTREQEVIPDMGPNFVQFRFAMGNPDKELRFHRALQARQGTDNSPNTPTLFAWHGSALPNWHSILRQGLDFNNVANGRAYGNGVYFSPNYGTSEGYMRHNESLLSWPNSSLSPSSAIALCEIINSPAQFQSSNPHYVVAQLDWIQCRYLFIHSTAVAHHNVQSTTKLPVQTNKTFDELPQDLTRPVIGPGGTPLKIPRKAFRGNRYHHKGVTTGEANDGQSTPKRAFDSHDVAADDTDEEDVMDLEALRSGDECSPPPPKRFQAKSRHTRDSSVDSVAARRLTTQRPLTPPKQLLVTSLTDFRPGTLDLTLIPRLALPEWANPQSSRRLASDIRTMEKVQSTTPYHELGWYMDFDKIENMFQWIVELHTFDPDLPLAQDMKRSGVTSIVLEMRFGKDYPFSPPFVRVIRPKFLPFLSGGGGHVTIGGAICMEMLTSTGWVPTTSLEAVLVSIKAAMSEQQRPARLEKMGKPNNGDYNAYEAVAAFRRFASVHGWTVPQDAMTAAAQQYTS